MILARVPILLVSVASACMTVPTETPTVSGASTNEATLSLSCADLASRNGLITNRIAELEGQQASQARTSAVTDMLVGVGMSAIIGTAVGAGSSISGIRAASATVQGIEAVRAAERGSGNMQGVSDVLALAGRSSELQRAMIEKGC